MFAVVQVGSHQFRVAEGDTIEVNRLEGEEDKDIVLDQVLLFSDGKNVQVGRPFLKDVQVKAQVVEQTQGKKVIAFRYRLRKDSKRKVGHRQQLTALNITAIAAR